MATILTALGLVKQFGARTLLRGVQLSVDERERIALIGVNGSGKSTLLRMLVDRAGGAPSGDGQALVPDEGKITWRKGLSLRYVPQEPRFSPRATVGEVLAASGAEPHVIAALSDRLALPPAVAAVEATSIGERRRVALAQALLMRPEVLCLDEPTNHLDMATVQWLERELAAFPGALLFVTHDRYFLDRVATRIVELDRGELHSYEGNYSEFLLKQAERQQVEAKHEHQRSMFVRREIDWIRRAPQARGTKAKARIERFDAAVAAAPLPGDVVREMTLRLPTGPRLGGNIVELRDVTLHAPTPGAAAASSAAESAPGKLLVAGLTLVMKPGDRVGIVGPNGVGKTTLIRTILGERKPDRGEVVIGANTRFSYMEQSRIELDDDATVLQAVADGYDYVDLPDERIHVRSFLRRLLFADATGDTKVGQLSGGERNRVQLAKLLRHGGNVIVLDEPTNDLDLMTLGALEDALVHFPGCALVVSHDRWFLDRVVTAILAFEGDGRVTLYEGSYSSYVEKTGGGLGRGAESATGASPTNTTPAVGGASEATVSASATDTRRKERPRKLSFKETAELANIEATIEAAEAEVARCEAELADPFVMRDRGQQVPQMQESLAQARTRVEALYARWQELEQIRAASER